MKKLFQLQKTKCFFFLMMISVFTLLMSSCSKEPNPKAIVSEWVEPWSFQHISGRPVYFKVVNDANITQDLIDNGQVLSYLCIVDAIDWTNIRRFFRIPYTLDSKKVEFGVEKGSITFNMNYDPSGSYAELHYFCYILLPKGFKLPNINLDNFDEVASYFKIDKQFILTL